VVALEHTDSISDLICTATDISITFNNLVAFQTAQASWTSQIVLVAFHPNCGSATATGARDYILVNIVAFSAADLTVTASVTHIDISQAIGSTNEATVDLCCNVATGTVEA
jgi:hypothetical protein